MTSQEPDSERKADRILLTFPSGIEAWVAPGDAGYVVAQEVLRLSGQIGMVHGLLAAYGDMLRLAENLANDAALVRLAQAEALRTAARTFVTEMGDTWGGDSQWLTTGTRVAEVVACVLREMAAELEFKCSTCAHPEGYDRLSGPCPTCGGAQLNRPGSEADQ